MHNCEIPKPLDRGAGLARGRGVGVCLARPADPFEKSARIPIPDELVLYTSCSDSC